MADSDLFPYDPGYRVEVSGWDDTEKFFVEKSDLAWNESSGKHIFLRHQVPKGALIFVRLLQSTALARACPVAYEPELLGRDEQGGYVFRLNPAQPNRRAAEEQLH